MKKLKKIFLHELSQAELQNKEMQILKGGGQPCLLWCTCSCGCKYSYPDSGSSWNPDYYGGSGTDDNNKANEGDTYNSTKPDTF